mgnify:CR=1 FL=1
MTEEITFTPINFSKPDEKASKEYEDVMNAALDFVNTKMLALPNLKEIIGAGNKATMLENHKNHALFINAFIKEFDTKVLPATVAWVFKVYTSRGFKQEYWTIQLSLWQEALRELMSEHGYSQISPIYKWMIANINAAD